MSVFSICSTCATLRPRVVWRTRKRAAVAAQTLQEAVQVVDITPQPQRLALQAETQLVILLMLLLLEDPLEEPELVQMEQQESLRQ